MKITNKNIFLGVLKDKEGYMKLVKNLENIEVNYHYNH